MKVEKFPVADGVEVLASKTIYKTDKWWCAALLTSELGKRRIALYTWMKRGGRWRRKHKFAISPSDWHAVSRAVEELLEVERSSGR